MTTEWMPFQRKLATSFRDFVHKTQRLDTTFSGIEYGLECVFFNQLLHTGCYECLFSQYKSKKSKGYKNQT